MKIIWTSTRELLEVYGVYSSSKGPLFCVSPNNYSGLIVLNSNDCILVDGRIADDLFTLSLIVVHLESFVRCL